MAEKDDDAREIFRPQGLHDLTRPDIAANERGHARLSKGAELQAEKRGELRARAEGLGTTDSQTFARPPEASLTSHRARKRINNIEY